MRWRKTDSKKIAKIIKSKIKNIDATTEEIAKKTKTSKAVVSRILNNELKQIETKSDYIAKIIDSDKEIMRIVNEITLERIKLLKKIQEEDNTMVSIYEIRTVVDIAEKSFKRYILLKWNVTDKEWGLKSLDDFRKLSDDDLLNFLKK